MRIVRTSIPVAMFTALLFACATAPVWDGKPTNDLPNPYRTIAPWGKLPASHAEWGALNGVAVDRDGRSLWVVDRCGKNPDAPAGENPFLFDTCAGSSWPPVHELDPDGNIVRSFGAGLFVFPHKIYPDREGNIWVVDMRTYNERERRKHPNAPAAGHTAIKFDREGRVLMTIGRPGVAGDPKDGALTEPCSIVEAPNGDLFIAEGHSGNPRSPPGTVARISRFTKEGEFVRSIGKLGSGPVEFMTPHDIAMDEQGRLLVADRGNHRIQVLDQDGHYIGDGSSSGGRAASRCAMGASTSPIPNRTASRRIPDGCAAFAWASSRPAACSTGFPTRSSSGGRAPPRAWRSMRWATCTAARWDRGNW